MRRHEREITDPAQITALLQRCRVCRVGFYDNGEVYIVPMNYGFTEEEGLCFYFHGAKEGRKAALIAQKPEVGFELDADYELIAADFACGYSARYASIIGQGVIEAVEQAEEKRRGLQLLMQHETGRDHWEFSDAHLEAVAVFRLRVTEFACKGH